MDPLSLIEGALVAGAAASTQETASQAVKDAYSGNLITTLLTYVIHISWTKTS